MGCMTKHEIVAKIAEAFYLFRQQNDFTGNADGDWRWAENAVRFFENADKEPIWDEWHKDEYEWVYPLYLQLTGQDKDVRKTGY